MPSGGKGRGQGRKVKYPNGSTTVRVPNELVDKVKKMIEKYLKHKESKLK